MRVRQEGGPGIGRRGPDDSGKGVRGGEQLGHWDKRKSQSVRRMYGLS